MTGFGQSSNFLYVALSNVHYLNQCLKVKLGFPVALGWWQQLGKWNVTNFDNRRMHFKTTINISLCQPFCCKVNSSPLDKMTAIAQMIFSAAFSWMKSFVFWFKFHWNLFLGVQLTITQHWFRYMLGAEQATSHNLNPCSADSLKHICDTKGRWVKVQPTIVDCL